MNTVIRYCFVLMVLVITNACTSPLPQYRYTNKSNIGLINGLESQITHTYLGVTAFNNFEKEYSVDWNIPDRISKRFLLNSNASLIDIKAPGWLKNSYQHIIVPGWGNFRLNPAAEKKMTALCQRYKLDALVVVYSRPAARNVLGLQRTLSGYGIYSQRAIGNDLAVGYMNAIATTIHCYPPALTATAEYKKVHEIFDYIEPEDNKKLPATELEKVRHIIEKAADSIVDSTLKKLGVFDKQTL